MAYIFLITILLSVSYGGFAVDVQCPEEGCGNLTIYLGPKWGSKVIILSPHEEPSASQRVPPQPLPVDRTDLLLTTTTTTTTAASEMPDIYNRWRGRFGSSRQSYWRKPWPTTTSRSTSSTQHGLGVWDILNLTDTSITGEELKTLLSQLTEDDQSHLQYLYLGYNNISGLPMFTFPMVSELHLDTLSLDNNPLKRLTYDTIMEISRLSSLKTLNLSRCGLTYLDCPYSGSLMTLDLSYNHLESLPAYLDRLSNLRRLFLDGNQIHYLHHFPPVPNLQVLSLSSNRLSYVGNTTFSPLESLRNLYELRLDDNSLKDVSVVGVNPYATLYLRGNPWECSCPLVDLVEARRPYIADLQSLTCLSPERPDTPRLVEYLRHEDVRLGCRARPVWDWVQERLEDMGRWFRRHGIYMYTVYHALVWLLLVVVAVVAVRLLFRRQKKNSKIAPALTDVPYTILDDKILV